MVQVHGLASWTGRKVTGLGRRGGQMQQSWRTVSNGDGRTSCNITHATLMERLTHLWKFQTWGSQMEGTGIQVAPHGGTYSIMIWWALTMQIHAAKAMRLGHGCSLTPESSRGPQGSPPPRSAPHPGQPPACLLPLQISFHFLKEILCTELCHCRYSSFFLSSGFYQHRWDFYPYHCISSFLFAVEYLICADDAPIGSDGDDIWAVSSGAPWCLASVGTCTSVSWRHMSRRRMAGSRGRCGPTVFQSGSFHIHLLQYAGVPILPHLTDSWCGLFNWDLNECFSLQL